MWPMTTKKAARNRRLFRPWKWTLPESAALNRSSLPLGEHLGQVAADLLTLPGGEVPVDRLVQAVHELHPRLPAEELFRQAVARHPVQGAGGHVGKELDLRRLAG